jgi:hypothetical protein
MINSVKKERAMKSFFSTILLTLLFAQPVFAYETGTMTCEDIGKYAETLMSEREKGQKKEVAMASIDSQEWQGEIERSNMAAIVDLIHGKVGNQLADAQAAYAVIKRDCDVSKARQK